MLKSYRLLIRSARAADPRSAGLTGRYRVKRPRLPAPLATAAAGPATAGAAARVLRLRARFVDHQRAATQLMSVEPRGRHLGFLVRGHFHEGKAQCSAGRHVAPTTA